jgi:hypothetical protein
MAAAQGVRAMLKAPVTTTYLAPAPTRRRTWAPSSRPAWRTLASIWALVWVPARTAAICTMMSLKPPLMIITSFVPMVLVARKRSTCSVTVSVAVPPAASGLSVTRALPRAYDCPPAEAVVMFWPNRFTMYWDQTLALPSLTV